MVSSYSPNANLKILSAVTFLIKLLRILSTGEYKTLALPLHDELDKGTLKAIIRQTSRYIPEPELHGHFYYDT